jgi:hypothetical protein
MLFDIDENEVPIIAPVQHEIGSKEHEIEGEKFVDDFHALADKHGYTCKSFPPPKGSFTPIQGRKYLIMVGCPLPEIPLGLHALAIDEHGNVFDPSKDKPDRVSLSDYDIRGIVELTPKP